VILKLAVSADGCIAGPHNKTVQITGEAARARAHLLRAQCDAILVGIGTVLADDPQLTCRLPGMASRSPVRVVLDRDARLPPISQLVQGAWGVPLWVFAGMNAGAVKTDTLTRMGADVIRVPEADDGLSLAAVLAELSRRGITRLLVEGGAHVAASLLRAELVDEAQLFRAETVIGVGGVPALFGLPLAALTHGPRLRIHGEEKVGADNLTIYRRD
jgi:diaminohydroxyphosphoribosylaminopyrimidine deaminase/5-amino-6-(5-phosphoribosylamino)uracil reductase